MPLTNRDDVARDLQKLYDSNRGALYANSLVQAQAAFETGDFVKALELVRASREVFVARHKKTLKPEPGQPDRKKGASRKEVRALEHKESKLKEIFAAFDAACGHLERMARLQRLGNPKSSAGSKSPARRKGARCCIGPPASGKNDFSWLN